MGFADGLRAIVRQLTGAIYAYIAFSIAAHAVGPRAWSWLLEPAVVALTSVLLGRIVDGPWWTSSFVGAFAGLFDLFVLLASGMERGDLLRAAGVDGATVTVVGILGGVLGRRWRRRAERSDGKPGG
jgi:hypothetical protein